MREDGWWRAAQVGMLLLVLGHLTTGCATRVRLVVLVPAAVYVPSDIRTLAVIDRSRPGNLGQGVVAAVEGAFSGEELGVDTAGRTEAIRGLTDVLRDSPRFQVVQPMREGRAVWSGLCGKELSWRAAKRICAPARCQGIVALEAFDSDSVLEQHQRIRRETRENGEVVQSIVYEASRSTKVTTAWRLYDVLRATIIDQVLDVAATDTWTETGETEAEALDKLPSQLETVQQMAYDMGVDYARRIAPSYVEVTRKLYIRGDPRLKKANRYVKAGTWEPAVALWKELAQEQDPTLRGRANFNLALAAEVEGDLDRALTLAQAALADLDNHRAEAYVRILQQRIEDQKLLRQQMAHPPPRRGTLEYRRGERSPRGGNPPPPPRGNPPPPRGSEPPGDLP